MVYLPELPERPPSRWDTGGAVGGFDATEYLANRVNLSGNPIIDGNPIPDMPGTPPETRGGTPPGMFRPLRSLKAQSSSPPGARMTYASPLRGLGRTAPLSGFRAKISESTKYTPGKAKLPKQVVQKPDAGLSPKLLKFKPF